mmetsp:Transcript_23133/g.59104  ORF Transcript_23133/g.59104 Transcript_23133/m.59104 type:complete len:476 (-) Transcript_23133:597-2024(-)
MPAAVQCTNGTRHHPPVTQSARLTHHSGVRTPSDPECMLPQHIPLTVPSVPRLPAIDATPVQHVTPAVLFNQKLAPMHVPYTPSREQPAAVCTTLPRPTRPHPLGRQALGVAWEHGGLADVVQAQVQHDHALQAHARAAVGRGAQAEGVDVRRDGLQRHAPHLGALGEQLGVVDALRARDDLLAADEHVVRVGVRGVVGAGHGVEGADGQRVPVQDVKVGAVARLDHLAQRTLQLRGQVAQRVHIGVAVVLEQRDALGKREAQRLEHGHVERVLRLDHRQLLGVRGGQAVKDGLEQALDDVQHLVVVLVDGHLKVQAHELAQVAVRPGLLRAEHGPDLKHALAVGRDGHLLVQLRRLRQARGLPHVVELEHGGAALAGARDELGRVDLDEVLGQQVGAEDLAHRALHAEDGLVGGRAQVQEAVVQAVVLAHGHQQLALLSRRLDLRLAARRVGDLKGQRGRAADDLDAAALDLHV